MPQKVKINVFRLNDSSTSNKIIMGNVLFVNELEFMLVNNIRGNRWLLQASWAQSGGTLAVEVEATVLEHLVVLEDEIHG